MGKEGKSVPPAIPEIPPEATKIAAGNAGGEGEAAGSLSTFPSSQTQMSPPRQTDSPATTSSPGGNITTTATFTTAAGRELLAQMQPSGGSSTKTQNAEGKRERGELKEAGNTP